MIKANIAIVVFRGLFLHLVPRAVLHPFLLPFFAPFSARFDSKKGARGGDWVGDLKRGRPWAKLLVNPISDALGVFGTNFEKN